MTSGWRPWTESSVAPRTAPSSCSPPGRWRSGCCRREAAVHGAHRCGDGCPSRLRAQRRRRPRLPAVDGPWRLDRLLVDQPAVPVLGRGPRRSPLRQAVGLCERYGAGRRGRALRHLAVEGARRRAGARRGRGPVGRPAAGLQRHPLGVGAGRGDRPRAGDAEGCTPLVPRRSPQRHPPAGVGQAPLRLGDRAGPHQPGLVVPGTAVTAPERLVVIGGDASGMTAASLAKKMRPDLDVVALEKGPWTSYSACGIPYVIGGDVDSIDELVVRTPEEHQAKGIDARAMQEATAIDLDKREVEVRDLDEARTYRLGFDQLIVATGAIPRRPPLPGFDDEKVHGVQTLDDGAHLLAHAEKIGADRVVVVGAGYIGLEIAEAFVKRGATVTVGGPG